MNRRLMLVDLNHMVCRSAFTGADPVRMVSGLIRRHSPTHLVLCRDSREATWRKEADPAYKANREGKEGPSSNDLVDDALPRLEEQGWCVASSPGFEGDDVVASLTKRAVCAGTDVLVVSGDKDLWQLAGWATVIYPSPGKETLMNERAVFDALGVWTHQIPCWKALAGDKGDNIPRLGAMRGTRFYGFTERSAANLLSRFGNLEDIYSCLTYIEGKEREWLKAGQGRAFLNRRLATLREDAPVEIDPRASRLRVAV